MKTRQLSLVAALAVIVGAAPAAVWGFSFTFPLTGSQMVPRVSADAFGSCVAILVDEEEGGEEIINLILECTVSFEATAGHIHRGAPGRNGPRVFTFDDDPDGEEVAGVWKGLSIEDGFDLLAGNLYVRIPSEEVPRGQVRGQIRGLRVPPGATSLKLPLSGRQEVPPVDTPATGSCQAFIPVEEDGMLMFCAHTVQDPIAADIHVGAVGEDGPIIVPLGAGTSPFFFISLFQPDVFFDHLAAGNLYVNVRSEEHPNGELRGQIDGCLAGLHALCLNGNRFKVEVAWRDFEGKTGQGVAVPQTADSGLFWFFGPDNTELMIKVLDACGDPFNTFWVFLAATTNLDFSVTVTDTGSGQVKEYTNDLGLTAETVLDTQAFATCP